MDLSDIHSQVAFNLQREGVTSVENQIDGWINEACQRRWERSIWPVNNPTNPGYVYAWSFAKSFYAFTLSSITPSYPLPSDFLRPLRLAIYVPAPLASATYAVTPRLGQLDRLTTQYFGSSSNIPSNNGAWAIDKVAGELTVFPSPEDDYGATLYYMMEYTQLTQPTSHNTMTDLYGYGVVLDAARLGAVAIGGAMVEIAEQQKWAAECADFWSTAMQADREQDDEEEMTLHVSTDVYAFPEDYRVFDDFVPGGQEG